MPQAEEMRESQAVPAGAERTLPPLIAHLCEPAVGQRGVLFRALAMF